MIKVPTILPFTHLIYFNVQWIDNVMMYQFKIFMTNPVLHVPLPPSEEVVHYNDLMALHHESVHKM